MSFLANHTVVKFLTESLWRDEAFSWAMANQGLGILPLTARDFNPPLYYLLLYAWMQIAGSSELAMRSLSLVFFAGLLWVLWRFSRDLLDVPRQRAALYVAFAGLNPMLLYYAVEARMYSLVALLAALSFYALLTRRSFLYVVSTTAALYTHYFMALAIGCQLVAVLFTGGIAEVRERLRTFAAPWLLLMPWVVLTLRLKEDYGGEFWVERPGWKFVLHILTSIYTGHDEVYGFLERPERWVFALCLIPIVLWSLWAAYRWADRRLAVASVALWALVPPAMIFVVSFVKPLFVPRYLIFSSVGLVLLLIVGMERARPAVRSVMLVLLGALAINYQVLQAHRHSKGVFRETIRGLAQQGRPDDLLFVTREHEFFPAEYYFGSDRVFIFGRPYEDIKAFSGKVLIPRAKVVESVPPGRRVYALTGDRDVELLATQSWRRAGD